MIICAYDLETSGLAIGSSKILEIACALYDSDSKRVFQTWSTWVWDSRWPPIFDDCEALKINGLKVDELKKFGSSPEIAFKRMSAYMNSAQVMLAQNGNNFDKPFLEYEFNEYRVPFPEKVHLDSRTDFPYPESTRSKRLGHLAIDHGIVVLKAHRALDDVLTMLQIANYYDMDQAFERAKSPLIRIEATIPIGKNGEAKSARFRWDPLKKCWWKQIRSIDFDKERTSVSFQIRRP